MMNFLVPHVSYEWFHSFVVFEDGVLAGVDEVCAEFASLINSKAACEKVALFLC